MAIVTMPALSPTMTEGKLAKWLVKEGDDVRSGDVIAEIETDKAVMEVEALDDGKMASILIPEGTENVAVGAVIAEILDDGEESTLPDGWADQAAPVAESAQDPAQDTTQDPAPVASAKVTPPVAAPAPVAQEGGTRLFASPLARRIAADRGIDLNKISGSGPKGRIIKADLSSLKTFHISSPFLL